MNEEERRNMLMGSDDQIAWHTYAPWPNDGSTVVPSVVCFLLVSLKTIPKKRTHDLRNRHILWLFSQTWDDSTA